MRKTVSILIGLAGVLFLAGCNGAGKHQQDVGMAREPLKPAERLQFHDIPVPYGFALISDKSFAHEAASFRFAQLRRRRQVGLIDDRRPQIAHDLQALL